MKAQNNPHVLRTPFQVTHNIPVLLSQQCIQGTLEEYRILQALETRLLEHCIYQQ